jgi:hypothetical protein
VFSPRDFAAAGGLISYSGKDSEMYRIAGVYAGRILKGDKPADYAALWRRQSGGFLDAAYMQAAE